MVTDFATHQTTATPQAAPGVMTRVMDQVRQFICGLHGHDALLHFEKSRMSLQCTSCGYQTPGWDLKRGIATANTAPSKSRDLRIPLVGQRRVA
jgi:hypothetical protein